MREKSQAVDVLVMGAGAIGLYLGGRLGLAGLRVHFVARSPVVQMLLKDGLLVTTLEGSSQQLPARRLSASESLADAPSAALILLTVKGCATRSAAESMALECAGATPVISFQNGVDNVDRIAAAAPELVAIAGMVPFNVVQTASSHVRQTTSGRLAATRCAVTEQFEKHFIAAGLPLELHEDMRPVQWGKLLLNLNNPLNALAGIPLIEELEDRAWRRILADLQDEALMAMRAADIRPARVTPLPTRWLPSLLRLPTPLFRRLVKRMLTIDPQARSSMYDDRVRGRTTEIDDLCGAVVRLAQAHSTPAPLNIALTQLLHSVSSARFYMAQEVASILRDCFVTLGQARRNSLGCRHERRHSLEISRRQHPAPAG